MLVRVVRAVVGTVLLLIGLPLLLAGGALWFAMQHQDPGGGYSARLSTVSTDGYAVVASDVDSLLRRAAPFARGGQTTLRLIARTGTGQPAFVGLAPAADAARYLADVPYTQVDEVRLARGPLPVVTAPVDGTAQPAGPPPAQPFWIASSVSGILQWSPYDTRDQQLALVVMDPAGTAPLTVDLTAQVEPRWLGSTTLGLLVLGTVLLVAAVVALAWPNRAREIVYVVPPAQVPEIAARLGVPVSRDPGSAPDTPEPAATALGNPESTPAGPDPGRPGSRSGPGSQAPAMARSLPRELLVPELCLATGARAVPPPVAPAPVPNPPDPVRHASPEPVREPAPEPVREAAPAPVPEPAGERVGAARPPAAGPEPEPAGPVPPASVPPAVEWPPPHARHATAAPVDNRTVENLGI